MWPHRYGEHVGEAGFGVRAVVREIWELLVVLAEAFLHRGSSNQYYSRVQWVSPLDHWIGEYVQYFDASQTC